VNAADFFLVHHARVHAAGVGDPASMWERVFAGIDDAQMRTRPAGMNSLAWLLWHTARVEDVNVNLVVTSGHQVFDEAWSKRLGIGRVDIGTGMTDAEVTELSRRLDLAAARAYRNAVGKRTREVAAKLRVGAWDEVVTPLDVNRAVAAGAFGPHAGWVEKFWQGVTKANRLGATGITHNAMHLGEAAAIRGQLGAPVGM